MVLLFGVVFGVFVVVVFSRVEIVGVGVSFMGVPVVVGFNFSCFVRRGCVCYEVFASLPDWSAEPVVDLCRFYGVRSVGGVFGVGGISWVVVDGFPSGAVVFGFDDVLC